MWLSVALDLFSSICVKRVLNVSPSAVALGAPVSSSPALCPTDRGSLRACLVPLALSELAHHLMVLVAQNTGQEEGSFVRAPCLKAPPGPALSVDGHIPLPFRTGTTLATPCAGPCLRRLGRGVVPWCIGVIAQLMNALQELTLSVEDFLKGLKKNLISLLFYIFLLVTWWFSAATKTFVNKKSYPLCIKKSTFGPNSLVFQHLPA